MRLLDDVTVALFEVEEIPIVLMFLKGHGFNHAAFEGGCGYAGVMVEKSDAVVALECIQSDPSIYHKCKAIKRTDGKWLWLKRPMESDLSN